MPTWTAWRIGYFSAADLLDVAAARRRVAFRIKLNRLHQVLQAAMGWTNSHLYEFRIRDVGFGLPEQD
jgi:hypothetical protein